MQEEYLYHYKKTRKQRSLLFIRMGALSLFYIVALFLVEAYTQIQIPDTTHNVMVASFSIAAAVLFYIGWWHIKNPATYEAYITAQVLSVDYPGSDSWSFRVRICDIAKIEHRQSHSSGGKSIVDTGVVMKNGDFHKISMNYGNNINTMFKALKSINPDMEFPKTINTRYFLFGRQIK